MNKKAILTLGTVFLVIIVLVVLFLFSKKTEKENIIIPKDKILNTSSNSSTKNKQEDNGNILSNDENFCIKNGGVVGQKNECGNKVAICTLKDGTECGLNDYKEGNCKEGMIVEWGEACR